LVSTDCVVKKKQVELADISQNCPQIDLSANLKTRVKTAFANLFATPSFAAAVA